MSDYIIGRNAVKEALRANRSIQRIMINSESKGLDDIIKLAKSNNIEIRKTPLEKLNTYGKNHQGVVALVSSVEFADLTEVIANCSNTPLLILLDGIEDPHNTGAIIRSAECFGATAVLFPKRHSAPINSTVAKTSAGALEHIPLVQIGNISQTIKLLKKSGFWIFGAHMDGVTASEVKMDMPMVLVIGNEGKGISRLVKDECDYLIKVPMQGQLNSLNASVAASILMYEVRRNK